MSTGHDPHERWRWEEEQRERPHRDVVEHEGRLARDTGDPRWGTGGMPADERAFHAHVHAHQELRGRKGPYPQREAARHEVPSFGPYVGLAPRGYRRSDERVREDICERFTAHGYLDPSDVEVAVRGGEAMLTGTVRTRAEKRLAEDLAEAVPGVTEVHNHLRVQPREPREDERPTRSALPTRTAGSREGAASHR